MKLIDSGKRFMSIWEYNYRSAGTVFRSLSPAQYEVVRPMPEPARDEMIALLFGAEQGIKSERENTFWDYSANFYTRVKCEKHFS